MLEVVTGIGNHEQWPLGRGLRQTRGESGAATPATQQYQRGVAC